MNESGPQREWQHHGSPFGTPLLFDFDFIFYAYYSLQIAYMLPSKSLLKSILP